MRKNLIHFLLVAVFSVCSTLAFAQTTTVRGQLVDSETGEPLIGATVMVEGTTQGSITDVDGYFEQSVASGATLLFKYVGYKDLTKKITQKGASTDLGIIKMEPDAVMLKDVVVTSSVAVARKTPVAVSTIQPVFIEEKLGTKEFPEILKSTPGVYATKQGGGFGDSRINMRGFESENIAVMINGVPMNDMEWGGVYWSNWAGLSDVTRSMQTQRGLGASKVSAPSVGGSINIVTKTVDAEKGGSISYALGNDGLNKLMFNVSTGMSKSGWALTLLGAKTWADGYIQGTEYEAYNWFVNLTKRFNDNHQLSFTGFGAPQWHNQRNNNDGLRISEWQKVAERYMNGDSPYKYNPTFGYGLNGERKTSARNAYHKPQLSLNHLWQIDSKSSLSTALYASIGNGYGYSGQGLTSTDRTNWYGASDGIVNTTFRHADGTFAYDEIYALNQASENGSVMAMSKSYNKHTWIGLLSTYTTKFGEYVDFYGGIDFRYYKGVHTNELCDLYGGEYFVDSSSREGVLVANNAAAAAGPAFVNQKLKVGDVVYRDYDGYTLQEGVFAQAEYNRDKLSTFVAGSISNTGYWRYDRFYYDKDHAKSKTVNFLGWTAKGGLNYNLTEQHNVFANVGYISRAPFFSGGAFLQSTTSNLTNPDAINEKVFSAELGYGFRSRFFTANLNLYHTKWMNKTMSRGIDLENSDGVFVDRINLNMSGVNAIHQGIELDFVAKPFNWLDVRGMFSLGNWRWDCEAKGYFYDSTGQPIKSWTNSGEIERASGIQAADHASMTIVLDGTKVGNSAQTTAALGIDAKVTKDLSFGLDWNYYGRNYADWSFSTSDLVANGIKVYESPWEIPSASVFDFSARYRFNIGKIQATLYGNIDNIFNQTFITDAQDGASHTWEDAEVFYAWGRTYSLRLKIDF